MTGENGDAWRTPQTRFEKAGRIKRTRDPQTGEKMLGAYTPGGRLIDKNRSDGWRGYKSHLTPAQRKVIAWALRQRDRGISRIRICEELKQRGIYKPGPGQYPISQATISAWELTRKVEKGKGRAWPLPGPD